jgi:hypothetical protein
MSSQQQKGKAVKPCLAKSTGIRSLAQFAAEASSTEETNSKQHSGRAAIWGVRNVDAPALMAGNAAPRVTVLGACEARGWQQVRVKADRPIAQVHFRGKVPSQIPWLD